jgi:hypothetical protein
MPKSYTLEDKEANTVKISTTQEVEKIITPEAITLEIASIVRAIDDQTANITKLQDRKAELEADLAAVEIALT